MKSKYFKAITIFSESSKRLFCIFSLVLSISFIILDNHFIYEAIIVSRGYFLLREKVRSFKSKSGLEYQIKDNRNNNLGKIPGDDLQLRMGKISASGYIDESTIISINGSNRLGQMKNFLEIYRNSSMQSNTIILGDLIHEFSRYQIDTLFVPFPTKSTPCYELARTLLCQIESLSWFIYPIIVERFDDYTYQLSESQYLSIKPHFVTVEGSDNVLINIPITTPSGQRQNYYLFSYNKEIFVYPLSNILSI